MSVMGAANRTGYLSGEQRFAAVMIAVSLVLFILIRRAESNDRSSITAGQ